MHEGNSNQHHHNAFSKLELKGWSQCENHEKEVECEQRIQSVSGMSSTSGFAAACRWFHRLTLSRP